MEKIWQAIEKQKNGKPVAGTRDQDKNDLTDIFAAHKADPLSRRIDIDKQRFENSRIIAGFPEHEVSDSFRILRTQIERRLAQRRSNSFAVTSARREEGKSLISANLAVSFAMQIDRNVLLVEADLRNPDLADKFSVQPPYGLSDYLLDEIPIARCICKPGIEGLSLITAGSPQNASSELLTMRKMKTLVHELNSRSSPDDVIIYDLPPLLAGDDAMAFLDQVDSCLLVVSEGLATKKDIQRAMELVGAERLLGTVLNKSTDKSQISDYYPITLRS